MAFEPTDRVPLVLRFWSLGGEVDHIPFNWRDPIQRVEHTLALGLDDTLTLQPPLGYVEEYVPEALERVTSHTEWLPPTDRERYPLLKKVYETPDGPCGRSSPCRGLAAWRGHPAIRRLRLSPREPGQIGGLPGPPAAPAGALLGADRQLPPGASALRAEAARLASRWMAAGALGDAAMWLCGSRFVRPDGSASSGRLLDVIVEWELAHRSAAGKDVTSSCTWPVRNDRLDRQLSQAACRACARRTRAPRGKLPVYMTKPGRPISRTFGHIDA